MIRPGGSLVIAMSHRCFPAKAVRTSHVLAPIERTRFVASCVELTGAYEPPVFRDRSPPDAVPVWRVSAVRVPGGNRR